MALGWYSELSTTERRTFWACFGGYTLDALDSTMYALVAPVFIAIVGFTKPEIGALTTTGLIGNCVGGWIAGIVADKLGRLAVLKFTVLWVAGFSALAACCTSHDAFFAVRFLQGLGFGGEAAVAGVLISEVVRPHLRGRVVASVQSGYGFGYALSTMLMPVMFGLFAERLGWRAMFAAGVMPALVVLYIRRYVGESPTFQHTRAARHAGGVSTPFWRIFDRSNLRLTLLGLLLSAGVLGGGFGVHAWLPTYLRLSLHLRLSSTTLFLALSITGLLLGRILGGAVSGWFGRRRSFVLFLGCEAVVVVSLLFVRLGAEIDLVLMFLQGALQGAAASCMLPTFTELFRTEIRASGTGFCITGGRGLGSISTALVGVLATLMPLGHAMGACTLAALALAIIAALLLPDRAGIDLETLGTTTGSVNSQPTTAQMVVDRPSAA